MGEVSAALWNNLQPHIRGLLATGERGPECTGLEGDVFATLGLTSRQVSPHAPEWSRLVWTGLVCNGIANRMCLVRLLACGSACARGRAEQRARQRADSAHGPTGRPDCVASASPPSSLFTALHR